LEDVQECEWQYEVSLRPYGGGSGLFGESKGGWKVIESISQRRHAFGSSEPFGVIPKSKPEEWNLISDWCTPDRLCYANDEIQKEICLLYYWYVMFWQR